MRRVPRAGATLPHATSPVSLRRRTAHRARRRAAFCLAVVRGAADNARMTLSPLGDSAVVLAFVGPVDSAMAARVHALAREIERHAPAGTLDVVPAFVSVTVFYEVARIVSFEAFCAALQQLAARADAALVSDQVPQREIPVCYGGEHGPDLQSVAEQHGLSPGEVIALHSSAEYLVHAIGFVPGFPYLGGLPTRLATPRRATPRAKVPAGSVGIGGAQTGIYPLATPGGWNLIGRTPLALFDPRREAEPTQLQAGDRVKFVPIEAREFAELHAARVSVEESRPAPSAEAPQVEIVHAGMFTTVQDRGRRGRRAQGVPLSGAADPFAARLANLLVGNDEGAAVLECTLLGPELRFSRDTLVALGGAEFEGLPGWQPQRVAAGETLRLGRARQGCRGVLAIAGGVEVPPLLGSRSTYVRAQLGGVEGRALRDGDRLALGALAPRWPQGRWHVDARILPRYGDPVTLRVMPGAQAAEFEEEWEWSAFKVTAQSDRMGARLSGPALVRRSTAELLSTAVAPGTIQVPPDGQPIVLLADAQTLGGYPQLAHVIAVDLPLAAQLRPGATVQFETVTLAEAHELALAREHALAMVREGLAPKFA